eukprot:763118-Hanusia_phi.AAC.1
MLKTSKLDCTPIPAGPIAAPAPACQLCISSASENEGDGALRVGVMPARLHEQVHEVAWALLLNSDCKRLHHSYSTAERAHESGNTSPSQFIPDASVAHKRVAEKGFRRWPVHVVGLEAALEEGASVCLQVSGKVRMLALSGLEHRRELVVVLTPGQLARQQLEESTSQAPDVRQEVGYPVPHHLGRHESRGPKGHAGPSLDRLRRCAQ